MKKIDLHMHSKFSDGDDNIDVLVERNKQCGNEVIAVTDHDNVESIEALEKESGISYIPGVELSCADQDAKVHILGYGISKNGKIRQVCDRNAIVRRNLSLEIIEDLVKRGYMLDAQELQRFYSDPKASLSKVDIAKLLVKSGEAKTVKEAFYGILSRYKIGKYIRNQSEDIINIIKDEGGLSVLAHAFEKQSDPISVINRLVEMGIDGLELSKTYHNATQREIIEHICKHKGLIVTDGSDYHGKLAKPDVELGCELDGDELDERLKEKIIER